MRTIDDVRHYLEMSSDELEEVNPGTWIMTLQPGDMQLVIRLEDPVLVFRMFIMKRPTSNLEAFYTQLLTMNANDLVHGAFALEEGQVVLVDSLQVENLDLNEVQASVDSFSLAMFQLYPELAKYI